VFLANDDGSLEFYNSNIHDNFAHYA